jgi:hypothetical protein
MSTITVLLVAGIAAYVVVVAFVLALLSVARQADDAADQHARDLAAPTAPVPRLDGRLDRRAAREPGRRALPAAERRLLYLEAVWKLGRPVAGRLPGRFTRGPRRRASPP